MSDYDEDEDDNAEAIALIQPCREVQIIDAYIRLTDLHDRQMAEARDLTRKLMEAVVFMVDPPRGKLKEIKK